MNEFLFENNAKAKVAVQAAAIVFLHSFGITAFSGELPPFRGVTIWAPDATDDYLPQGTIALRGNIDLSTILIPEFLFSAFPFDLHDPEAPCKKDALIPEPFPPKTPR